MDEHFAYFTPVLIALELTRSCKMNCIFCRANAKSVSYEKEITTQEYFDLLDDVADHFSPIILLSGGDPMEREDIFQIAEYGTKLGLNVALSSCGHSYNEENLQRLKEVGVFRITMTLSGATKNTHDEITGRDGSFDEIMRAIEICKNVAMPFQINTTVVMRNFSEVPLILELVQRMGASSYQPFFFVPMGRGSSSGNQAISPKEYEKLLNWLYDQRLKLDHRYEENIITHLEDADGSLQLKDNFLLRPSCAPQNARIVIQKNEELQIFDQNDYFFELSFNGCKAGKFFAFISHRGRVQTCGMLEIECGDIRNEPFSKIWETSKVFRALRDPGEYKGKCGSCHYLQFCGGCRARAYIKTRDYLEEDSYCLYRPEKFKPGMSK